MSVIPQWLVGQYTRAKSRGWVPYFAASSTKYNLRTEDVMAVASRESNMSNIKGDFHDDAYHGFSLMQLDINSHRVWIEAGKWQDVRAAIDKGCAALAEKRDQIVTASKQTTATIKFRSGKVVRFTPKPFNDEQLRRMTLAAYNCGLAAYYHFSIGNDIDAGTTGKNYSKDVLKRSQDFKDLMARDAFGKTANDRPIEQPPAATGNQVVLPAPIPQAEKNPFTKIEEKYDKHADLIKSPKVKTVAGKLGSRIGGGLITIWSTTTGKIALVLTAALIVGVSTYYIYKYRHQTATFFIDLKNFVKGKI